jgi:hypothetical protein
MKSKFLTTKGGGKLSPPLPDPDLAAWCAALSAPVVTDTVPPGWFTSRQLAKKLGKSESRMGHVIGQAVAAGRAERQEFRITTGAVTRPVPHYRLK